MGQTEAALRSPSARRGSGRAAEESLPSYKERVAFIQTLKRKWMLQKGYCSVFDRLREQKMHKMKSLQRREELDDRKKKRKRLVAARLRRTSSGQELQPQPQVPLETLQRSKSNVSQQMETTMSKGNDAKGKLAEKLKMKGLRPSRSRQADKEVGFGEFALLANASKRSNPLRTSAPRPRTYSPSKSQRDSRQPYNKDIHELTHSSQERKNQSPRSLKEWTEEKAPGQSLEFPQKAPPHLNSSLTLKNTLGPPLGATIHAKGSDVAQMNRVLQQERLGRLYDVAKQDMETLERLLSNKQLQADAPDDSQDS